MLGATAPSSPSILLHRAEDTAHHDEFQPPLQTDNTHTRSANACTISSNLDTAPENESIPFSPSQELPKSSPETDRLALVIHQSQGIQGLQTAPITPIKISPETTSEPLNKIRPSNKIALQPPVISTRVQTDANRRNIMQAVVSIAEESPMAALPLCSAASLDRLAQYYDQFKPSWDPSILPNVLSTERYSLEELERLKLKPPLPVPAFSFIPPDEPRPSSDEAITHSPGPLLARMTQELSADMDTLQHPPSPSSNNPVDHDNSDMVSSLAVLRNLQGMHLDDAVQHHLQRAQELIERNDTGVPEEETMQIRTSGGRRSQKMELGQIQQILRVTQDWKKPVTEEELENSALSSALKKFFGHAIDVHAAAINRDAVNAAFSGISLSDLASELRAQNVEAKVLGDLDQFLEKKTKTYPIMHKQNQCVIGHFIAAAEQSIEQRGYLSSMQKRRVKKHIVPSIDIDMGLSEDIRTRFTRALILHHIDNKLGIIHIYDTTFGYALESIKGGFDMVKRVLDILEALEIAQSWREESEQLKQRTEETAMEEALERIIPKLDSLFPIDAKTPRARAPMTPPSEEIDPNAVCTRTRRQVRKRRIDEDEDNDMVIQ